MKIYLILIIILMLAGCGQTVQTPTGECSVAQDCKGKPHVMCVGEWNCVNAECAYECAQEEPVEAPVVEPEVPVDQLNAPVDEPENPVDQPKVVVDEPENPVDQPKVVETTSDFDSLEISQATMDYVVGEIATSFVVLSPKFKMLNPGEGLATAFAIKNNDKEEQTFRIVVEYKTGYDESNNRILKNDEEKLAMLDWVELEGNFTIPGNEYVIRPVKFIIPNDADVESGQTYEFLVTTELRDMRWDSYYGEQTLAIKIK